MATFANTTSPTPFGIYDSETDFKADANNIVTFVKRKLGDDILSVELTKKHNPTASSIKSHHVVRPIPQDQIDRTSGGYAQNPGYPQ